jgi:phosphatidylglycerophosphatase A
MIKIVLFFSSVCGIGYIKYASGTFASAAAAVMWIFVPSDIKTQAVFIAVACIVSVIVSSIAEKHYDNTDDSRIVIDELCGMWIAMFCLPKTFLFFLSAFLLFRLFDIKKPLFINKLQNLRGGLGVTADDIAAGVFANIILQVLYFAVFK